MGEAADEIIDGNVCELCGATFIKLGNTHAGTPADPYEYYEHGYPVVCRPCWRTLPTDERRQHQRATAATMGG